MSFLDSVGGFVTDSMFGGATASLDSLGWTQHGRDQYFQRDMQREFLESQQNFQREMTANQQDFTREMYNQQWNDMMSKYPSIQQKLSDIQFNNWRQQFDLQNEYNSYKNQVNRMLGAGINPATMYNGAGAVATNSMSPVGASAPPQISPTPFTSNASPIGLPSGLSYNKENLREIGGFLKDLAAAKQMGVQTDQLEKLFSLEVEERSARIFGQRLTNEAIGLANYVADKTKDYKVRKACEDLVNIVANTKNLNADTTKKLQETATSKSEELLNNSKRYMNEEEFEILKMKVNTFMDEFNTRMENIRSDTAKNNSEARLNNALADTENQLREGRVTAQSLSNTLLEAERDMKLNELFVDNRTLLNRVDAIIWKLHREKFITDSAFEEWEQNKVRSKWSERQQFADYCAKFLGAAGQALGGVGSAVSGYANWKNVGINDINTKERNRIQEEFNKIYYHDKIEGPEIKRRNNILYGNDYGPTQ